LSSVALLITVSFRCSPRSGPLDRVTRDDGRWEARGEVPRPQLRQLDS